MGSQKEVPLLATNPENIRLPGCLCKESIYHFPLVSKGRGIGLPCWGMLNWTGVKQLLAPEIGLLFSFMSQCWRKEKLIRFQKPLWPCTAQDGILGLRYNSAICQGIKTWGTIYRAIQQIPLLILALKASFVSGLEAWRRVKTQLQGGGKRQDRQQK